MEKNNRFDPSLETLTPEGVKFVLSPAGPLVRTLAYGIDKFAQWTILVTISIAGVFLHYTTGFWLILILNFCVDWFYHVICELAFHGQTPGKWLTGIRVVRSDGAPVDPSSSFLRNLLRFADTFFFFFPIAFTSMITSRGFRRLGDWAGGTLVVYSQRTAKAPRNITNFLLNYDPIVPQIALSNDEKQAIINFARRYHLLGKFRANEIAGIYAPYIRAGETDIDNAAYLLGIARNLSGKRLSLETAYPKDTAFPKETK
jgi:uncharacterized RDD family membrane protein YckC